MVVASSSTACTGAGLSRHRLFILLVGPIPIVLASWGVSRLMRPSAKRCAEVNHALLAPSRAASEDDSADRATANVRRGENSESRIRLRPRDGARPTPTNKHDRAALEQACEGIVDELRPRLGSECQIVVHAPFVLAGDLGREALDEWYTRTIGPAARAMARAYFPTVPDKPITVLLFSGEERYVHYARDLFGEEGISIYGYYKRGSRVLVMNIATGGGTLVHELTHALVDFDVPDMPDWLNEGIASLHEQCHIREDESGIDGLENWRLAGLQEAIRRDRLRSLESLIKDNDFRNGDIGVNYAQARYFILYLQRQDLLEDFFRRFRRDLKSDPLAAETVLATFPGKSWKEIDDAYRKWAMELKR